MVRKKLKIKRKGMLYFPVIGKYIDTPTNVELKVVWFMEDAGDFKLTVGDLPSIILKSCRFHIKISEAKKSKKLYEKLQVFLNFYSGFKELDRPQLIQMPQIFGLLKLRKGKKRYFVWIRSVDQYYKSKVINVVAAIMDNLLYLDLVGRLKKKS